MDELVAQNYVDHNPPPFPGLAEGREGLKQSFKIFWKATPGHHHIEDQIAEGDKVVTRLTSYGKHEGDLPWRAQDRQRSKNDIDYHPPHRQREIGREVVGKRYDQFPAADRRDASNAAARIISMRLR